MTILYACIDGDIERVKELLEEGAEVNGRDDMGFTFLMTASINGYHTIVALLLERGADIHPVTPEDDYEPELDPGGDTALLLAVRSHHDTLHTIRLLLEAGADVNTKNRSGETALMWAFQHSKKEMASLLVQYGADVESHSFFKFVDFYAEMVALSRWVRRRILLILIQI